MEMVRILPPWVKWGAAGWQHPAVGLIFPTAAVISAGGSGAVVPTPIVTVEVSAIPTTCVGKVEILRQLDFGDGGSVGRQVDSNGGIHKITSFLNVTIWLINEWTGKCGNSPPEVLYKGENLLSLHISMGACAQLIKKEKIYVQLAKKKQSTENQSIA